METVLIDNNKKEKKAFSFLKLKNIPNLLLILVLGVRLFSYVTYAQSFIGAAASPTGSFFLTLMGLFAIWFQYTSIHIAVFSAFYDFRFLKDARLYYLPINILLNAIFFKPLILILQSNFNFSLLIVLYLVELVLLSVVWIMSLIEAIKTKSLWVNKRSFFKSLIVVLVMMIATFPPYFMKAAFGYINLTLKLKGLTFAHRIFLYLAVAIPTVLYFALRNKSQEIKRFALIYISVATMVGFLVNYDYTSFFTPWAWPFHLCNTAMFILPLVLIFRMKKFFYFTYFINVFGALLAMCMPNYADLTNLFAERIFTFWYNHWMAFGMPILCVALGEFERPKIKHFYWSMIGFLGYFILALFLNVYFTALGHEVDYFFINSNYVADKLGDWANKLFNLSATLNVRGLALEFHPFYQVSFFISYVLLGLAVWFVYSEFYRIADAHKDLNARLKAIKQYEYAEGAKMNAERRRKMLEEVSKNAPKLEVINFHKKYASSKKYAVKGASFEVHGGEIFGFLGPNGAGKSTIIKSIVGIQPITEGKINICGIDIQSHPEEAKYNIGYVPDHYALYEKLTGREYINYIADIYEVPKELRDERISRYIDIFQLEASIDSKIKTYSHGMKQKITIMAALVHNPKVWILDEPLTGLDPNSIYQVKQCMKEHAAAGNIVFFSSHIIDIVEKLCERIAIIKHGKIQTVTSIAEIEASGKTLEEFYLDIIGDNEEEENE